MDKPRRGIGRDNRFNPISTPVEGAKDVSTVKAPKPDVVKQSEAKPKPRTKAKS